MFLSHCHLSLFSLHSFDDFIVLLIGNLTTAVRNHDDNDYKHQNDYPLHHITIICTHLILIIFKN